MCLAIPGELVSIDGDAATVNIGGTLRKASLMLLAENVEVGDYVIVHAGFALHKVDPGEAAESIKLLRELASYAEDS